MIQKIAQTILGWLCFSLHKPCILNQNKFTNVNLSKFGPWVILCYHNNQGNRLYILYSLLLQDLTAWLLVPSYDCLDNMNFSILFLYNLLLNIHRQWVFKRSQSWFFSIIISGIPRGLLASVSVSHLKVPGSNPGWSSELSAPFIKRVQSYTRLSEVPVLHYGVIQIS